MAVENWRQPAKMANQWYPALAAYQWRRRGFSGENGKYYRKLKWLSVMAKAGGVENAAHRK